MRVGLPLVICFLVGVAAFVQFYVPHAVSQNALEGGTKWLIIISAFALVLGVGSLVKTHVEKIRRRASDWGYSIVAIAGLVGMSVVGITYGIKQDSPTYWLFDYVVVPLEATMFSLLAFFIASAAYRTFRARTPEATILLVAAIIVMLGQVPIGALISRYIPEAKDWLLNYATVAAKRGIVIGICLGVIATSLRIILGIERSYLGGD